MAQRLIADIGGTRARFALSSGPGDIQALREMATDGHPSFEAAATSYLEDMNARSLSSLTIAVAGPVQDGTAQLTNADWHLDQGRIAAALRAGQVALLNDFAAVACSVPVLGPSDMSHIGGPHAPAAGPVLVLGPGTGLGVAGLIPTEEGHCSVLPGEGGHVTLAARTEVEEQVLTALRDRFDHVSAERVISGAGLELLYDALGGGDCPPDQIAGRAADGDPAARQSLDLFAGFLGTVASDAALTMGATGGVYIAGGVIPRLGSAFDQQAFHDRFTDKGRFSDYLADIPVNLITHPQPGLLGLSAV